MPIPGECTHYQTKDGPRVPLRWGSAPTDVCTLCGMWRTTHHTPGQWKAPVELAAALARDDD